jgi:cation transport regulator ChaB
MKIALELAEDMPYDSWDELQENVSIVLSHKPQQVRELSCLIWSIERFSDIKDRSDPAAIHIDLAERILSVPGAREAVKSLL